MGWTHDVKNNGNSIAQESNLKTHEQIHTGDKPFSCPKCGETFAQASNLKAHEKIHIGDKPFNCLKCGMTFAQASSPNQPAIPIVQQSEDP